jgi:hypothetical protein
MSIFCASVSGADNRRGESGVSWLRRIGRSSLLRGEGRSVVTFQLEWRGGGGGGGACAETRFDGGGDVEIVFGSISEIGIWRGIVSDGSERF